MTETPSARDHDRESAGPASADADSDAGGAGRLPPIRRHDENYSSSTGIGSRDNETRVSDVSDNDFDDTSVTRTTGRPVTTDETTRLPVTENITPPPAPMTAPAQRYQAPTPEMLADEDDDEPAARRGPGFAAALGIAGLTTAAIGLFALPLQQEPRQSEVLFGQLRSGAAFGRVAALQGADSTSLAGGEIATTFWRYGALGVIGGLALLVILAFAWAPLRLAGGILTFLGGVAAVVYLGVAARQTNKYDSAVTRFVGTRMAWSDWKIGFWVAAGGMVLVAFSGLLAVASRRR